MSTPNQTKPTKPKHQSNPIATIAVDAKPSQTNPSATIAVGSSVAVVVSPISTERENATAMSACRLMHQRS